MLDRVRKWKLFWILEWESRENVEKAVCEEVKSRNFHNWWKKFQIETIQWISSNIHKKESTLGQIVKTELQDKKNWREKLLMKKWKLDWYLSRKKSIWKIAW